MAGVDESTPADDLELPEDTWSVARLTREIDSVLDDASDRFSAYVIGDVSDIAEYPFGTFFDLQDPEEDATITCIAWQYARDGFEDELVEGETALVQASVDFYAEQGRTQLQVTGYWPLGESARAKEVAKLRAALEEEGLLAEERKRELPPFPTSVGVVTSPSGSAREDVCSAIHDRAPGTDVLVCGATVQGEAAVPSLIGAVQTLAAHDRVDVVVLTRGGGADADLYCFNEEPLVRVVADCATPTVVAVGHEDDTTLCELVADRRAMTPTDAGVAVTPHVETVLDELAGIERRVDGAYRSLVAEVLERLEREIETAHRALVQARQFQRQQAAGLERRIDTAYESLVETRLGELETRIERGYEELAADVRVAAGMAEARRLRVVVAVLFLVLLLVLGGVVLFIL